MVEIGSSYRLPDDARRVTAGAPWALARERFEVWLPAYDLDIPHDAHLSITWAPDREHYVVSTFEAIGTQLEPVTPESLRSMPLARLLAMGCRSVPRTIVDIDGEDLLMLPSLQSRVGGLEAKGPTPATLDIVARLYVGASAIRWKPAQHVADVLGLAPRTATHWIKLARDRGHFGDRDG